MKRQIDAKSNESHVIRSVSCSSLSLWFGQASLMIAAATTTLLLCIIFAKMVINEKSGTLLLRSVFLLNPT